MTVLGVVAAAVVAWFAVSIVVALGLGWWLRRRAAPALDHRPTARATAEEHTT